MLRGHIWTSRKFKEAAQREALRAASVRVIYVDEIDAAILSLRTGTRLVVAGFRGLGRTNGVIRENIAKVHARGAAVMDAGTGWLSTGKYCEAMIEDALKALANERRGPRKPSKKERRMPKDQLLKLYLNPDLSNDQLEEATTGSGRYSWVSYATLRRMFKRTRNVVTGRPSAARIAARTT